VRAYGVVACYAAVCGARCVGYELVGDGEAFCGAVDDAVEDHFVAVFVGDGVYCLGLSLVSGSSDSHTSLPPTTWDTGRDATYRHCCPHKLHR